MPPDGAILALDAMGVLYATGDDVGDLLVSFAHDKGSSAVAAEIEQAYLAASLGQIDAEEFWWQIGLDPRLEDDYLRRHRLADGFREFSHRKAIYTQLRKDIGPLKMLRPPYGAGIRRYLDSQFKA